MTSKAFTSDEPARLPEHLEPASPPSSSSWPGPVPPPETTARGLVAVPANAVRRDFKNVQRPNQRCHLPPDKFVEILSGVDPLFYHYDPLRKKITLAACNTAKSNKHDGDFRLAMSKVLTLIDNRFQKVKSLDLSYNMIKELSQVAQLVSKIPHVTHLNLAFNRLNNTGELEKIAGWELKELVLKGNPLVAKFENTISYARVIGKIFPSIIFLDDLPLVRVKDERKVPAVQRAHHELGLDSGAGAGAPSVGNSSSPCSCGAKRPPGARRPPEQPSPSSTPATPSPRAASAPVVSAPVVSASTLQPTLSTTPTAASRKIARSKHQFIRNPNRLCSQFSLLTCRDIIPVSADPATSSVVSGRVTASLPGSHPDTPCHSPTPSRRKRKRGSSADKIHCLKDQQQPIHQYIAAEGSNADFNKEVKMETNWDVEAAQCLETIGALRELGCASAGAPSAESSSRLCCHGAKRPRRARHPPEQPSPSSTPATPSPRAASAPVVSASTLQPTLSTTPTAASHKVASLLHQFTRKPSHLCSQFSLLDLCRTTHVPADPATTSTFSSVLAPAAAATSSISVVSAGVPSVSQPSSYYSPTSSLPNRKRKRRSSSPDVSHEAPSHHAWAPSPSTARARLSRYSRASRRRSSKPVGASPHPSSSHPDSSYRSPTSSPNRKRKRIDKCWSSTDTQDQRIPSSLQPSSSHDMSHEAPSQHAWVLSPSTTRAVMSGAALYGNYQCPAVQQQQMHQYIVFKSTLEPSSVEMKMETNWDVEAAMSRPL